MRDFHNSFHSGNAACFIGKLQVALDAEVQWTAYRTANNISARSGGYNKQCYELASNSFLSPFLLGAMFSMPKQWQTTSFLLVQAMHLLSKHTDYLCQSMPNTPDVADVLQ